MTEPGIPTVHVREPSQQSRDPAVRDVIAGVVVFLVALPLCLGIALASGAPLLSGIISGVIGGVVVGSLSGSHTSVSGPAAGLAAVVLAQIAALGSFEAFLLAVVIAGILQLGLGLARAGALSSFVPNSVIKGLLAAIGIILILKQIPHVLGRANDPTGNLAFASGDEHNTFSELLATLGDLHPGAALIGFASLGLLISWTKIKVLADSPVPAPLAVVLFGVAAVIGLDQVGGVWAIGTSHLVQVPVADDPSEFFALLQFPDFSAWRTPEVYVAGVTIAIVASLETLLNLEAVDKLDPIQRHSPPNRELLAQGAGNIAAGLLGGIPITAVIIRGSVNINANAASKRSAILHGVLLALAVGLLPTLLNRIPLACLAAILLMTGYKLASPKLIRSMWASGRDQFIPFATTVVAIVLSDLLIGLGIGMAVALWSIIQRYALRPLRRIAEKHLDGEILHIQLPDQLTFLNHVGIEQMFDDIPRGSRIKLDAQSTDYIDPDILALFREFRDLTAPARNIQLSMVGFSEAYELNRELEFVDYSTRELQDRITPAQVLAMLRAGHQRFASDRQINRDYKRQVEAGSTNQHPIAAVLSSIDPRAPAELLFDMALGDLLSVRMAGNVVSPAVLGSLEYATTVAGARLIVVLGHTRCGAVATAVDLFGTEDLASATGCEHLAPILADIQEVVDFDSALAEDKPLAAWDPARKQAFVDDVARRHVLAVTRRIVAQSRTLAEQVEAGRIAVVGVLFDVSSGAMEFMLDEALGLERE
jgi:MFS superfamily sulfate permease-like transporter